MTHSETAAVDHDLLIAVLDQLIPAEGGFPAGSSIALDHLLRALEKQPEIAALLDAVDRAAPSGRRFAALPEAEQVAVLRQLEAQQPEAFEALVTQTYWGYYSHPAVLELLGLDPRPPQPRGHVLEPFDERILDKVRQRSPIYRMP